MLVICNGQPKSGSSFVHQLVDMLAEHAGHSQQALRIRYLPDAFIPYQPHPHFVYPLADAVPAILEQLPRDQILVIKSHCPLNTEIADHIRSGRAKALCSFRDPRDAAVALADAAYREKALAVSQRRFPVETPLDAILIMAERTRTILPWLRMDEVLKISFEELSRSPFSLYSRLQSWLNASSQRDDKKLLKLLRHRNSIREYHLGIAGRHNSNLSLFEQGLSNRLFHTFDEAIRALNNQGTEP